MLWSEENIYLSKPTLPRAFSILKSQLLQCVSYIYCWMSILHCSYLMHSHLQAFTYIHIWAWRNKHLFNISHESLWYYLNDEKYSSSWLKKSCCTRAVAAAVSSWQIKLIREQRSIAPLLYCHIVIEAKFHSWAILI